VTPLPGEYPRNYIVRRLPGVAFALAPDSIGLAEYDALTCPTGWILIQRLD
jgi:hypothetical protein